MAPQKPIPFRVRSPRSAGFTLVEVALAIGIVAFAFVALLALLPAGQTAFRRAIDLSTCGQIAQRVINEAQQTDFKQLIDAKNAMKAEIDDPNFSFRAPERKKSEGVRRFFDDQGREIIPSHENAPTIVERANIIYEVNTRIMPRATLPAERKPKTSTVSSPEPLAQITVQIAHNPSGIKIPFSKAEATSTDPLRNLWVPSAAESGVQILTYSAFVGRNE